MRFNLIVAAALLILTNSGTASEENFALWGDVEITSLPVTGAGQIRFSAKSSRDAIQSVVIGAFGKEVRLSDKQLTAMKGFPLSSLSITHEAGYPELGGHTVHFKLRRVFYDDQKRLVDERLTISLPKDQEVRISKREKKTDESN